MIAVRTYLIGLVSWSVMAPVLWANGPIGSDAEEALPGLEAKHEPRVLPTEQEQNRQQATKLYATARMLEQKEDQVSALRLYQRALRLDPQSLPIAREIVPLAFALGRSSEAVRYALKTAEMTPTDAALAQRLAVHLTTQGEFERAAALYEKALSAQQKDRLDADSILLAAQVAKLYVATDRLDKAAESYRLVMQALASDDKSTIDSRTRRILVDDASKTLELLGATLGGRSKEGAAFDLYGLVMLDGGDLDGAKQAFDRAKQISPRPAIDAYQHALWLSKQEEWSAALTALQPYLSANESARGVAPFELLERILAELNRKDELVTMLERQPAGNQAVDHFLADQYRAAEDWAKAKELYERSLMGGASLTALRGLIEASRQTQDYDRLFEVLTQTLVETRTAELLGAEGTSLEQDAEAVDQILLRARERSAGEKQLDGEQLAVLAQFALDANRVDAGNALYESALSAEGVDKGRVARRWGLGLLLNEHYDDSVRVFQRALDEQFDPQGDAELLFHLAGALQMAGRTDDALQAAKRAVDLAEPNSAELGPAFYRIAARPAWVQYHAKRYADAEQAYRALIERYSNDYESDELRDALRDARLVLSNIAALQDRMPEAEEWLEQILDEFPDDISAHNDLGYLWADQAKNLLRARAMIEKAVAAEPENAAYLDSLGWVCYRQGEFDQAVEHLEAAIEKDASPDGVVLDHLGDAYFEQGNISAALTAWKRAAEAFEEGGDTTKMKSVQDKLRKHEPQAGRPARSMWLGRQFVAQREDTFRTTWA